MSNCTVVVVFFAGDRDLQECVASIPAGVEVVVVCTGDALPTLKRAVITVDGRANHGYGWACNQGIAASTGAVVIVSNADVVFHPGSVEALSRMAAEQLGALVAPLQCNGADVTTDNVQPGLGIRAAAARWLRVGAKASRRQRLALAIRAAQSASGVLNLPVPYTLSGACLAAHRSTWSALSGFDERIFLYSEDAEISTRARTFGFQLQLTSAKVEHQSGTNKRPQTAAVMSAVIRGEQIAVSRHRPRAVVGVQAIQVMGCLMRSGFGLVRGSVPDAAKWIRLAMIAGRKSDCDPRSAYALASAAE